MVQTHLLPASETWLFKKKLKNIVILKKEKENILEGSLLPNHFSKNVLFFVNALRLILISTASNLHTQNNQFHPSFASLQTHCMLL